MISHIHVEQKLTPKQKKKDQNKTNRPPLEAYFKHFWIEK